MKETYQCPAEGYAYPPLKTPQALRNRIRNIHPDFLEEKGPAREVPIVEVDFTAFELVRGKRTDKMRKAGYGAYDKLSLKQFKAIATVNLSPPRCP